MFMSSTKLLKTSAIFTVTAATLLALSTTAPAPLLAQTAPGPQANVDSLFTSQNSRRADASRVNLPAEGGSNVMSPALRIVTNTGQVLYVRLGERGLTREIFYNDALLSQFIAQILGFTLADVINFESFEDTSEPPATEEDGEETPLFEKNCAITECTKAEIIAYCSVNVSDVCKK